MLAVNYVLIFARFIYINSSVLKLGYALKITETKNTYGVVQELLENTHVHQQLLTCLPLPKKNNLALLELLCTNRKITLNCTRKTYNIQSMCCKSIVFHTFPCSVNTKPSLHYFKIQP